MKRRASALVGASLFVAACSAGGNDPTATDRPDASDSSTTSGDAGDVDPLIEAVVADGRLVGDWQDFGWASALGADGSVSVDLGDFGGWIIANPQIEGAFTELRLVLEVDGDGSDQLDGDFLTIQVANDTESAFPVVVPPLTQSGSRATATVTVGQLDPAGLGFDRIIMTSTEAVSSPATIEVAQITLIRDPDADTGTGSTTTPPSTAPAPSATPAPDPDNGQVQAAATIDCAAPTIPISPNIYGINQEFGNMPDEDWSLGAASRRWGGNTTSRYNWRTGDWNTAFDYYFQNVTGDSSTPSHVEFLTENSEFGLSSALTIPTLGWVAKDDSSASFTVGGSGEQQFVDPFRPNVGNGVTPDGDIIEPPPPTTTSEEFTPADATEWIEAMNADAAAGGPDVPFLYYLDNEPMLWDTTHRDVFTEPLGYDELLERTIAYATAIRQAQPDALIGGPSVWGWPAYFFSAIDAEGGFDNAEDRRLHENKPLIEWYLEELTKYEAETGVDLLDVLDVHFYPQDGSYSDAVDPAAVAKRLRTTRSLWDRSYFEESWIEEQVYLIPRMQAWVDEFSPGTRLSIGEYAFGAVDHISGGLAQAEALGRFGEFGLFAAYYWDVPPSGSDVYWAFRAYRDYDGNGSTFGELSVPTEVSSRDVSVFASTTEAGDRNVAVIVNLSPDPISGYGLDVSTCGRSTATAYQYVDGSTSFAPADAVIDGGIAGVGLPGFSITVLELT